MKKGCILKPILLVIVFIGIVSYLYKKYGDEIIESGKDRIKEYVEEKIQNSIDQLTDSVEKDSLQKSFTQLLSEIDTKNISINSDDYDKLLHKFNELMDLNKIDIKNIDELRNLIKEYERSENN